MEQTGLTTISELDTAIANVKNINTIPDARRLLALAQGYVVSARKLYNASDINTITDATEDKTSSLDIAKKGGELRLYVEARLGELIKAEQEAGRLRKNSDGRPMYNNDVIHTLKDYGLSAIDSSRAQDLAEHQDIIAKVVVDSLDIPTRAAVEKEIKEQARQEKVKDLKENPPVLPTGLYSVIAIDPPWPYGGSYNPDTHRVSSPYPELSIEKLMALNIPAADDCILWLWVTNAFMHEAYHILETWEFEPKTILTWFKDNIGVGYYLRGSTEHCLLATKGKPQINHEVALTTHLKVKSTRHSSKPDEFYELVETLCGKATEKTHHEMFARKARPNWSTSGNEVG